MGFNLAVFDKEAAPMNYDDFLAWFHEQTEYEEERDYDRVEGASPNLIAWFTEMKAHFPPMNGPYCLSEEESANFEDFEDKETDYSICSRMIYMAFAYSVAGEACEIAKSLVRKHGLGFFDPQTGKIIRE